MNKYQRKQLETLAEQLDTIKYTIGECADEEREKYDNMPENLQDSEKAEIFEQNADALEEIADDLDDIYDRLLEIIDR